MERFGLPHEKQISVRIAGTGERKIAVGKIDGAVRTKLAPPLMDASEDLFTASSPVLKQGDPGIGSIRGSRPCDVRL